jgi:acetyl-CoA acyltransferase
MGLTAETVAHLKFLEKIKMNLHHSHMKALKAQAEGDKQIVPITVDQTFVNEKGKKKLNLVVNKMKALEQGTSKEVLAGLRPVFEAGGSVTAGNITNE